MFNVAIRLRKRVVSEGGLVRTDSKLWKTARVAGKEVFVSPEGDEHVRATPGTETVVLVFPKLGPSAALLLRPASIAGLQAAADRKARRLERRERARMKRTARPSADDISRDMEREHLAQFENNP